MTINTLNIEIDGDLDPAKFVGLPGLNRAGFQQINIAIDINANASQELINEIINKAKARCPISDNISSYTQINYTVLNKAA